MSFLQKKKPQTVNLFPEIHLSSYFSPDLSKRCVVCDLAVWDVKSEEGCFLRTEIKPILLCACIELKHSLDYVLEMHTSQI